MSPTAARATPPSIVAPGAIAGAAHGAAPLGFWPRLRRALRAPRRLKFTREGKYFFWIAVGIGLAAINTGNNLLYLLLGMMLSLIIASGVLSEMSLRNLDVQRTPPGRIHAGRPFLMGISLKNKKRRFPSFSVEVEDLVDDKPLDKKCYFLKIPAGRLQQTSYRHQVPRRGRTRFSGFRVSTKFPFALFRKSRTVELPGEVIVFPAVHPIALPPPPLRGSAGEEQSGRRGRAGDFYGLRDYRDGEDPRDIHWRTSARRGRLMVREHEDESTRRVTLYLDNSLPDGPLCIDAALTDGLERAVSLAASLALHYLERGYAVRMVARGSAAPSPRAPRTPPPSCASSRSSGRWRRAPASPSRPIPAPRRSTSRAAAPRTPRAPTAA